MKTSYNRATDSASNSTHQQSSTEDSFGIEADQFQILRCIHEVRTLGELLNEVPVLSHRTRGMVPVLQLESVEAPLRERLSLVAENLRLPDTALSELILQSRFGGFLIPEALGILSSAVPQNGDLFQKTVIGVLEDLPSQFQSFLKNLSKESSLVVGATTLALVQLHAALQGGAKNQAYAHQISTFSQIAAGFEAVHSFIDFFTRMQGGRPSGIEPYLLNSLRTGLTRPLVELSLFSAAQSARVLRDGYTPSASFYLSHYKGLTESELCEVSVVVEDLAKKYPVISRLVEYHEKVRGEPLSDDSIRVPQMLSASDSYKTAIWYRKSFEALAKQIAQPNNRRVEELYDSTVLRVTGGFDLYFCSSTDSSSEVGIRIQFGRKEYSPLFSIVAGDEKGMTLQYAPLPPHVAATGLRGGLSRQVKLFDGYSEGRSALSDANSAALHDKKQQLTALANRMTILPAPEAEHNNQILRVLTALTEVGVVAGVHGTDSEDSATRSLIGTHWLSLANSSLGQMLEQVIAHYVRRVRSMTNE